MAHAVQVCNQVLRASVAERERPVPAQTAPRLLVPVPQREKEEILHIAVEVPLLESGRGRNVRTARRLGQRKYRGVTVGRQRAVVRSRSFGRRVIGARQHPSGPGVGGAGRVRRRGHA